MLLFSVTVMVLVSVFSTPKSDEELTGLTYKGVTPEQAAEVRESWSTWDVVNTIVILGIIVICYAMFF